MCLLHERPMDVKEKIYSVIFICIYWTLSKRLMLCCTMAGPSILKRFVGENAEFMWNNTCGKEIISATWGILKGTIADPQFINVDIFSKNVHFSTDMNPKYVGRVNFVGNLTVGQAWFILKNLTLDDNNLYIATIRNNISTEPFKVELKVTERDRARTTTKKTIFDITPTGISSTVSLTSRTTTSGQARDFNGKAQSQGLGDGAIVGIVVAFIAFVIITGVVVLLTCNWKKKKKNKNSGIPLAKIAPLEQTDPK